ncbi:MAG: sodium:proton antiporter [Candidatus Zixiibacteriota bacterium]|nr:MAG: sodium:proton antiporter [candidate division Zixibacteria bacterium]
MFIGLASVIVLGIAAQWLAWRLHLPSILLLLIFGIIAGPVTGILSPDALFGELLFPLVSVSVAIILFEGGLSLRLDELRQVGGVVVKLTTVGIFCTWIMVFGAAGIIIGIDPAPAILLGAVLVVSGPTVIIPLLRYVRPIGKVGSIVKWEGIVNDPIGAILAVLVFEVILAGGMEQGTLVAILGVIKAAVFGTVIGLLGALAIVLLLKRYLIPDFLQNPMSLMLVVVSYAAANGIQPESGLLAVTVMGIALANQKYVSIRHITEFKENLRVLLISSLFVILAARLTIEQLSLFDAANWIFVAALIFIVRPAATFISTFGSSLVWRERLFLAWMAPRGIVAAAVVSVFSIRLAEIGFPEFERLVPITFQVIIGTVAVYGLTAVPAARWLKLARPNPQGILFAGAHPWAQIIARIIKDEGFQCVLIDTNWANVTAARKAGCTAYYANILSENLLHDVQLDGIGRLLALTPNEEVNSLAALHFIDLFGRSEVYQLPPRNAARNGKQSMPRHLHGRYLFKPEATFEYLEARFQSGAIVKKTDITEEFTYESFVGMYGNTAIPMLAVTESRSLRIYTAEAFSPPKPGEILIGIVNPPTEPGPEAGGEKGSSNLVQ